ncbi:MAG: hypothetical protein IH933_10990 [Euryarchaeota archaeon]|nr:hypothetical protein [Euryarchaeota archaeon]
MDDYQPGSSFRVVDRLPAPITVQLLRPPDEETLAAPNAPVMTAENRTVCFQ